MPATSDVDVAQHYETAEKAGVVLVVDDDPAVTESVKDLLAPHFPVVTAKSFHQGLELLRTQNVAVILADQRLPDGTGSELLAEAVKVAPTATRVLFTGYQDLDAVVQAINQGQVYYYIKKPWQPQELRLVIEQAMERHRLAQHNRELLSRLRRANEELERRVQIRTRQLERHNRILRKAQKRIEELSRQDPLTGVANRRRLDEVLTAEVERSRRYGQPLSVIMVDLDHFKDINDTHGHIVGDKVLQAAAEVFGRETRLTDLVGRYGGEEFLLILPNTSLDEAEAVAERLRASLEKLEQDFRPEPLTASLGVAQWCPGDRPADLVHRADKALYEAKQAGRNRVVCAAPPPAAKAEGAGD
ncbi:MAG: diguanylate cyclase [Thermoleophilia bacterium]|nr:diguanylate cyclase [Thermoleophilia bacterium]